MRALLRTLTQLSINANSKTIQFPNLSRFLAFQKPYSTHDERGSKEPDWAAHFGGTGSSGADPLGWDESGSSWSTGLTKEHFDGEVIGQQASSDPGQSQQDTRGPGQVPRGKWYSEARWTDEEMAKMKKLEREIRRGKEFLDSWDDKMNETTVRMKQVREPGARGSYLKDSEKAEMYKKHKENPEVYTVERLAKEYRIMRQRVHAILWLKELEEEEEKKLGRPLDDSIERFFDACPELMF